MASSSASSTNSNDPHGLIQSTVKITGTAREDLNGRVGTVVSYQTDRGRYMVALLNDNHTPSSPPQQVLSLKPENLPRASLVESARHRFAEARFYARQARHDPQLRQLYHGLERALSPIPPAYLGAALALLNVLSVYYVGFSKTMLGGSLLLMPILVAAPDLVPQLRNGGRVNVRSLARSFPQRWHAMLVQSTGITRITPRIAMGLLVLFVLLSGKVLVTPVPARNTTTTTTPPPPPPPVSTDSSGTDTTNNNGSRSSHDNTEPSTVFGDYGKHNKMYKLGFEDASAGREYGHSLSGMTSSSSSTPYVDPPNDDLHWAYQPPPPPSTKSVANKLDFATMMAMFTLFRTGKQLGTGPDGNLSLELLVANLRTLDPMRMGLTGLALYRIVSRLLF